MFHEKLKYLRKKNLMSQEELAEKIHVSRQIITKWEKGIVLPSIEYLISLSDLFGITIDSLVKDDDCQSIESSHKSKDELLSFLVKAKKNTYASKKGKINSSRLASHDYFFQEGKYKYHDSFVGSSKFSGEEIVYEDDLPVYSMNYYGRVIDEHFQGEFLKEVLFNVPLEYPLRGPECYTKGDFHYYNLIEGTMECYHGKEEIFYQSQKVYECYYHGGKIE